MPSISTFQTPAAWLVQTLESQVFNPQGGQNKPYLLSAEQLAELGLPQLVDTVTQAVNVSLVVPHAPDGTETMVVNLQQPTHCDEVWLEQPPAPNGTEPVVLNPQGGQNKPYILTPEQLTELGLPQVAVTDLTNAAESVIQNLQQPTHCDEVWLEMPALPNGTEAIVLNVAESLIQNKSVDLTPDLLMQWGLPSTEVAATVDSVFSQFKLSAADVLQVPADAATGKHVLHVFGSESDTLTLSHLLGSNAAAGQWVDTGVVQQDGASFHSYGFSMDPSLQVLVDTHMHNVTVS